MYKHQRVMVCVCVLAAFQLVNALQTAEAFGWRCRRCRPWRQMECVQGPPKRAAAEQTIAAITARMIELRELIESSKELSAANKSALLNKLSAVDEPDKRNAGIGLPATATVDPVRKVADKRTLDTIRASKGQLQAIQQELSER